jgi:hypothetical protein
MMLCSPQPSCDLSSDFTADVSAMTAPATAAAAAAAAPAAVAVLPEAAGLFHSPEPSYDMASEGADTTRPAAAAAAAAAVRPAAVLRVEKRKEANRQNQRRMRQKRQEETDNAIQSVSNPTQQIRSSSKPILLPSMRAAISAAEKQRVQHSTQRAGAALW